jgi:SAM-dependent methyltransferase
LEVVSLFTTKRSREIQEIISDLESLRHDPEYREAAEINIQFFKAARSIFSFIHWLTFTAPKLRKKRSELLELGDLLLEKWQRRAYQALAGVERHSFGRKGSNGFTWELSQTILRVKGIKDSSEALVLLDMGFGGGELGRRVVEGLHRVPLVYIGLDITPANIGVAKEVFQPLYEAGEIVFREVPTLNDEVIDALRREASDTSKKVMTVCLGDIFDLDKHVSPGKIDIICHSRVLHHIKAALRPRLEDICRRLSPITLEMDDRYCFGFMFWSIVGTWIIYPSVTLLNGAIISWLRDPAEEELTGYYKLVPPFCYARLILGQDAYFQEAKWKTAARTLTRGFSFREGLG